MSKDVINVAIALLEKATKSEKIGKFICGEYLDGTTRSVADALSGEMVSPKQKKKKYKKNGKKRKNAKKHDKKKKQDTRLLL